MSGWGDDRAAVVRPGGQTEIAGDIFHVPLLVPEEILGPDVLCLSRGGSGGVTGSMVGSKVAAEVVAGTFCLLSGPGGFGTGAGLRLKSRDVGAQWWDCGFLLQGLPVSGLEGPGDYPEAPLLDPFQWLPNPLSLCRP